MKQEPLPFGVAEGNHAERLNTLGLALCRVASDKHLSAFVRWVFEATAGGQHGRLKKSSDELAARPWGLCCSSRTAERVVAKAYELGLIDFEETRFVSGSQSANEYWIDWEGVKRLLNLERRALRTDRQNVDGPRQNVDGPRQNVGHYKEETFSSVHSLSTGPDPAPAADAEPGRKKLAGTETASREAIPDLPELAATRQRIVAALPAGRLAYGVFAPLTEQALGSTASLVEWYRRQLGTDQPVTGNSEAHLLLVIASARYALKLPAAEVRKNRVAVFVSTVNRGQWRRVLPYVREVYVFWERPDFLSLITREEAVPVLEATP